MEEQCFHIFVLVLHLVEILYEIYIVQVFVFHFYRHLNPNYLIVILIFQVQKKRKKR